MNQELYNSGAKASLLLLALVLLFTSLTGVDLSGQNLTFWLTGLFLYLMKIAPLCLLVRGLINKNRRTHIWACYLSMFYFIWAVLMATDSDEPIVLIILANLSTVGLFLTCMMYYRTTRESAH